MGLLGLTVLVVVGREDVAQNAGSDDGGHHQQTVEDDLGSRHGFGHGSRTGLGIVAGIGLKKRCGGRQVLEINHLVSVCVHQTLQEQQNVGQGVVDGEDDHGGDDLLEDGSEHIEDVSNEPDDDEGERQSF